MGCKSEQNYGHIIQMSGSDLLEKGIVVGLVNFGLVEYNDLSIQRTGDNFQSSIFYSM